jgi:basic membrane protein A
MVRKFRRREFLMTGAAALGTSLLLKACTNSETSTETSANQDFKIAIVLPGIITDRAWNQSGYEGIELAKQTLPVETAYSEKVEQADQAEALSDFARRGYQLVYAHGGQFDAAIEQVAPQFPETFFVGVNGAVSGENMASLRIDHLQGSYLCGMIGASMTQSNKMAYLTAQSFQATDEELRGFQLGAESVKPDIEIIPSYTNDWNDAAKAKEATLALISSGVDVVYQWLDNASPAVLQTCAEKNVWAFGNTSDQLAVAPQAVLTSAVKRLDRAIAYLAELAVQGNLKGQIYTIGLEATDILFLGQFGDRVPEDLKAKALELRDRMIEQKIIFEPCQVDGKPTRCVKEV